MLKEFKKFIMTGNVIDLAVAVLLASAIGLVVSGFVNDIMMPIVGYFTGGVDFSDMKIVLSEAVVAADGTVEKPESAVRYGAWINSIIKKSPNRKPPKGPPRKTCWPKSATC